MTLVKIDLLDKRISSIQSCLSFYPVYDIWCFVHRELYRDLDRPRGRVLEQNDRRVSLASSTTSLRDLADDDSPMEHELNAASFQNRGSGETLTYSWLCGGPGSLSGHSVMRGTMLPVSKQG